MSFGYLLDLASLTFIVGSLLSIAAVVRFRPNQFRLLADAALPIGLVGFLIGVVSMLAAVSDPDRIAPALAVAILTVLYSGAVRLVLSDTLNQPVETEHSMTGKVLGTLGFLAMTMWAMVAVSPAGAIVFWEPQVALTLISLTAVILGVGRALNLQYLTGWANKLVGLAWLGFTAGIVAALPNLDTPASLGPALAFSILSLLYALIALILGLIWMPRAMTATDGSLAFGPELGRALRGPRIAHTRWASHNCFLSIATPLRWAFACQSTKTQRRQLGPAMLVF